MTFCKDRTIRVKIELTVTNTRVEVGWKEVKKVRSICQVRAFITAVWVVFQQLQDMKPDMS